MTDPSRIFNMSSLLAALETDCADRVILRYLEDLQVREVTGAQFFEETRCCAAALERLGLTGKHIGIMGANRQQWLACFCAVFHIGAVAVLLSPELNREELAARASLADVDYILYDKQLGDHLPQGLMGHAMDDLFEADAPVLPCHQAKPEDLACILFTSGTTAAGKAVMLSHRAMIASVCHNVVSHHFDSQLAILPMHHVAGFATVLNTWYLGRTVCLGQDVKYLCRYLEYLKPDYTLTVPSLLQAILHRLKKGGPNGRNLGWNLRLLGCGGAKFPPEVIRTLNDHNIRVLQSYGATEIGGLGFDWEMTPECADTIGKPCPEIETKIVDGELYLRCDSMMTGYYKDPEGTNAVLRDGWYATGDLCRLDERGFLHLTGRKKNLILRSNGENVSPEEIEGQLSACGEIAEIMIGLDNDLITATVYPVNFNDKTIMNIQEALAAYNRSAPTYKQVQNLHFSDTPFAKTDIGKMIRHSVTGGNVK